MATMEDLTKTQIVLLTLLVSFITSIATGIITTALLAQAPASVTQTINRVVEHTIETVVPSATSTGQTVKEVTVIKEDDAILSAVDSVHNGVVTLRVHASNGDESFFALGAIVSKDGTVVSDGQGLVLDATYTAVLSDGTQVPATLVTRSSDQSLAIFKLVSTDKTKAYTPVPLAGSDPKLGQTVIAFEGTKDIGIAVGRVQSLGGKDQNSSTSTAKLINTDLPARGETAGGPLITLSGELVGIKSSSADLTIPAGIYTALSPIKGTLALQTNH